MPMIFTAEGPGFAALAQVLAAAWTLMSAVERLDDGDVGAHVAGASSVPVIQELPADRRTG